MKIISWNTRGMKNINKRLALRRFLKIHMPDVILIQESKKEEFDALFIKSPWSSKDIGRDRVESFGTLGGMLIMLDRSKNYQSLRL